MVAVGPDLYVFAKTISQQPYCDAAGQLHYSYDDAIVVRGRTLADCTSASAGAGLPIHHS